MGMVNIQIIYNLQLDVIIKFIEYKLGKKYWSLLWVPKENPQIKKKKKKKKWSHRKTGYGILNVGSFSIQGKISSWDLGVCVCSSLLIWEIKIYDSEFRPCISISSMEIYGISAKKRRKQVINISGDPQNVQSEQSQAIKFAEFETKRSNKKMSIKGSQEKREVLQTSVWNKMYVHRQESMVLYTTELEVGWPQRTNGFWHWSNRALNRQVKLEIFWLCKNWLQDFPGGSVAKTPHSQCKGLGFDPLSRN